MLPDGPGVQGKSNLDGGGIAAQAYGRNGEYRAGGKRPFQNYQYREGAPTVLKGQTCEILEEELGCLCMEL